MIVYSATRSSQSFPVFLSSLPNYNSSEVRPDSLSCLDGNTEPPASMAQQNSFFNTGYRQGLGPEFELPYLQGGSAPMDRVQGLSNDSISTNNSADSTWTKVSCSSNITGASPMSSWEEVEVPYIKYEDDPYSNSYNKWEEPSDNMEYSPSGSQGFSTPMLQPSSFTETAIDLRPTPTSLRWNVNSRLLEIYKFVVGKGGKDPYFELLPGFQVTPQTPARVYLDYPKTPKKGAYPCQYPWGCTGKQNVFTRPADLERHYKNVHADSDQKDSFRCDYAKCGRSHEPFTRKDHYRDHLRDYHKEDLGCAKAQKKLSRKDWAAEQTAWLAERKVSSRWWRCARCLVRRQVQDDEWECPTCKIPCEQERIDARLKQQQQQQRGRTAILNSAAVEDDVGYQTASSMTTTSTSTVQGAQFYECGTCREYSGWVDNGMGEWVECPDCSPRAAQATFPVVDDYYGN